ncbi:hypothetical protein GN244_ATG11808 [Phytophthora infestans]|uniref:Uncharacterized protein n=1 Tax=Phytophthora infestans TaxID=4787 RepID=A0A833S840_PHYIN|nr:hypothetical protein GN244_ATG11808 [Phytophthora infestans]KAF4132634.1 hypothetical protein GN958_ATG18163 [Phytophthora infestans]
MASRGYSAAMQKLTEAQDFLSVSISDLNFLSSSILSTKKALDELQGSLRREEQTRLAADAREIALLQEVARLRVLLQEEREYSSRRERVLADVLRRLQQDEQAQSHKLP